ncbi:MAG: deoxyribose-phosphate aldolase, partial [Lachnospiraceae bacterium]|nr:deoxyribose-phosphate aldolase [Lachnospiraceae bacterium]
MEKEQIQKLIGMCDHTLLLQGSTTEEIHGICDDAMRFQTASICIPPCYVKEAKEYMAAKETAECKAVPVCTVIGFPNGNHTTAAKVFETKDAIENGADEIDMVINIGKLKEGSDDYVLDEIRQIKAACGGRILKVIIETCLLTEEEKIRMCHIVTESGADFIKTSTGFSTAGATFDDVALFAKYVGPDVKIKAAGGIASFDDAA